MRDTLKQGRMASLIDYLVIAAGMIIYSLGIDIFIRNANIPLGGVNGIALILNQYTGFPMGITIAALNIPLFILAFRSLGRKFIIRTMTATFLSSVFIDLFVTFIPTFNGDPFLSAIGGGFLMGLGLGLTFSRGATSGGSDILSKLINKKAQHISIGMLSFIISALVIAVATIISMEVESGLYAFITVFITSITTDWLLTGMDSSMAAFVVTSKPDEVSEAIIKVVRRGATGLRSTGMYTKKDTMTILCAIRNHEITEFKRVVNTADPAAFVIVTSAKEILGLGFKGYGI